MVKFADIEMGFLGGIGMAASIFLVNLTGGVNRALIAAALQFVYSFTVIMGNTLICRVCASKKYFLAIWLPTIITTLLTYLMHLYAESPEPFWSAAFAFSVGTISFAIQAERFKRSEKSIVQHLIHYFRKHS